MLIARAPVRLSLAGGGTDLPAYYEAHGGAVLSTTINKHFYVFLDALDGNCIQISSSDYQTFYRSDGRDTLLTNGELPLPRAILSDFGVESGLQMFLASEVPPGTGLGSSSCVTVAIIKAISTALDQPLDKASLADRACRIEIDKLGAPIGKQDQYATAFGGMNWIEFTRDAVTVEPLRMPADAKRKLESNLMLFFTGSTRSASKILKETTAASKSGRPEVIEALHSVKAMAYETKDLLLRGDVDGFGALLHLMWERKKKYAAGVSTPEIDAAYTAAREAGAVGGKIAGAGGGGFLVIYADAPHHDDVTDALHGLGMRRMDYRFENRGAQVLMEAGFSIASAIHAA